MCQWLQPRWLRKEWNFWTTRTFSLADEPEDFARALIELYESEELWNRLSENGIRKTRALYSTDAARKKLEFLFSDEHLGRLERIRRSAATRDCASSQELILVLTVSNTKPAGQITGKISANPNPIPFGQDSVVISWETNDPAEARFVFRLPPLKKS